MGNVRLRTTLACLATLAALAPVPPARGEERAAVATRVILQSSDPCGFWRSEAFGRGLMHYATEMLWACEAIADRRAANVPLGDRLATFELALTSYREAVVAAGRQAFAHRRDRGWYSAMPTLTEAAKHELAESTGALAALDAIRAGF